MDDTLESLKSEIKKLRAELAERIAHEKQLELVIDATGVGIWDWYVQTGQTIFNERWANIIGYTLEELSPVSIKTWLEFAHPDDLLESEIQLQAHWAGKTDYYIFESRMRHKDGRWVWVYDTGRVIEWERPGVPKRMIGTHLDINEHKTTELLLEKANQELESLVRIDPLSSLANRRGYDERIAAELLTSQREKKPLSMLMIDIDHFKKYNDEYGHEKGDLVIQKVSQQIRSTVQRKTDFVARYGGEEFVVLLPATPLQEACKVAKKILKGILELNIEHTHSNHDQMLTASLGVATTDPNNHPAADTREILERADKALYRAKDKGRNQIFCLENSVED